MITGQRWDNSGAGEDRGGGGVLQRGGHGTNQDGCEEGRQGERAERSGREGREEG